MCSVSTDFLYLPPRLGKCQNHSDSITTLHPVNLALIEHFFSPETYNSIMGDTTFAQPIDLTIPNFHIYNHTFSNILAQDKQYHLSLKRMAQAASKEETIFTSLSEPLVDGELPVSSDWPDRNGIISIAALGLTALLALVCLVLFRRLQTLTTAFLLLQKATPIHGLLLASPMPTFHYVNTHQSTTEDTNSYIFNTQCNPWPFVTLSIITTATLALFIIYVWKKFQQTQGTKNFNRNHKWDHMHNNPIHVTAIMSIRLAHHTSDRYYRHAYNWILSIIYARTTARIANHKYSPNITFSYQVTFL
ncbi:unnamed protein product [Mytilus coruscus]|uniref:Uncharacterized protein n=1 Tax=Mytilus coruscus TaxID=42192 RepID=A0A6J8CTH6_MYTCO|nr:unnamed protein product [Mytilus coruscus]